MLALGVAGVLASAGYAGGPRPYAARGLAEAVFFVMFGVVAVAGAYYIQAAAHGRLSLPWTAWVAGLPVGALVTGVLVIDDLRDRAFDGRKRWRTTAVRFGARASRLLLAGLTAFAYLGVSGLAWAGGLGAPVLLPWLSAPAALGIVRHVWRARVPADLQAMTPRMSMLSLGFAVLLALGIGASAG